MASKKNERIEALRDAFAKAATANDPAGIQLIGRELLTEYANQPKLSKHYQMHRDIVHMTLVTMMAMDELRKDETFGEMSPEQRDRLPFDLAMMAMDVLKKQKQ
ncbi:hypothetical protein HAP48_0034840 [Bradyrhizobium septentrionale]|uniref:Uncharacterized protein n=1 Tax=Bradyrhizobium septentrionale TaxID=1404411 RepID=A0A973W0D7_9BRAD|nr:hypothetical protein [Bradyrhizobium septentrionale]UGY13713.1 hypothetical protein HAP48_0034840 [Bradyrhizobium septentrionale]